MRILHICYRMIISKELFGIKLTKIGEREMDRKEKILSYMCSKEYIPLKFAELMIVLDVPAEDEEELRDILTELCIEGKIYMTKKGRYMSVEEKTQR